MAQKITINFIAPDGRRTCTTDIIGKNLMQTAVSNDIDGMAADCGGLLTCATCHVYVQQPFLAALPPADNEELAMLAFTAQPARPDSRLSCQIRLTAELDGLTVELPASQY